MPVLKSPLRHDWEKQGTIPLSSAPKALLPRPRSGKGGGGGGGGGEGGGGKEAEVKLVTGF